MLRYIFNDGPLTIKGAKDADAQSIGEALAAVAEAAGGQLVPRDVVDAARDPANALHRHFEWDDAAAAEKFRHGQARDIIRSIRVEDTEANREPERAFLSVADDGVSYRSVQEIRSSADLQQKILIAAERDLDAFTARYRALKDVCAIVERAKSAVKAKRSKDETRNAA